MDKTDWLLATGVTILLGLAFGLLLPPYGWIVGVVIAALLLVRGKKKRDSYKNQK